jgi:hypothetical protein
MAARKKERAAADPNAVKALIFLRLSRIMQ